MFTRYPAQEKVGGDSKIPSIIYYDKEGQFRAAGAEALQESLLETAEDEEWTKVEWYLIDIIILKISCRTLILP
jgi:hypothetical protein